MNADIIKTKSPVLELQGLCKSFRSKRRTVQAVSDVSFSILPGESFGLIGESGSGKSTIGALIAGFEKPDQGSILLNGKPVNGISSKELYEQRKHMQMIFQKPFASFVPQMKIGTALAEAFCYYEKLSQKEIEKNVKEILEKVGLPADYVNKYPTELSGGECQRAAIGRALLQKPELLICDEMTSALDVSVQAQIIQLMKELRKETGMTILFISHDIALTGDFCDRIAVMKEGKIIEMGNSDEILQRPKEEYTKNLLSAVLQI